MGIWAKAEEEKRTERKRRSKFLAALRMTFTFTSAQFPRGTATRGAPGKERPLAAPGEAEFRSVGRGVVTGLCVDGERRETFRRAEFDLDLAPASVVRAVAWSVSEYILVTQLHADLGRDVRQII